MESLDFFVRFWELKARHASIGEPLRPSEQMELLSLMQLVTHDLRVPRPGPAAATRSGLRAELIGDGSIQAIEVRSVTAAAIIVTASSSLPEGARVVVRAADAIGGVEYVLPCTIAWVYPGKPNTLALALDGVPRRQTFSSPPESFGRSVLAFGSRERLEG